MTLEGVASWLRLRLKKSFSLPTPFHGFSFHILTRQNRTGQHDNITRTSRMGKGIQSDYANTPGIPPPQSPHLETKPKEQSGASFPTASSSSHHLLRQASAILRPQATLLATDLPLNASSPSHHSHAIQDHTNEVKVAAITVVVTSTVLVYGPPPKAILVAGAGWAYTVLVKTVATTTVVVVVVVDVTVVCVHVSLDREREEYVCDLQSQEL